MGYKTFKAHTMKKEKRGEGRLALYKIILVGEFRDKLSV